VRAQRGAQVFVVFDVERNAPHQRVVFIIAARSHVGQRHGQAVVLRDHVGHGAADLAGAQDQHIFDLHFRHFISPAGHRCPVKRTVEASLDGW